MAMNAAMLSTNEQTREMLKGMGWTNWTGINFTSSAVAGFLAASVSMPFDNAKTRLQNMRPDKEGK